MIFYDWTSTLIHLADILPFIPYSAQLLLVCQPYNIVNVLFLFASFSMIWMQTHENKIFRTHSHKDWELCERKRVRISWNVKNYNLIYVTVSNVSLITAYGARSCSINYLRVSYAVLCLLWHAVHEVDPKLSSWVNFSSHPGDEVKVLQFVIKNFQTDKGWELRKVFGKFFTWNLFQ